MTQITFVEYNIYNVVADVPFSLDLKNKNDMNY